MRIGLIKALAVSVLVTTFSCKTASVVSNKVVTKQTDSTITANTKEYVFDSTYFKPAINQIIEATLDTAHPNKEVKYQVSNGGDTLSLTIKGNKITAKSNCDALLNRYRRESVIKDSTIKALQANQVSEATNETIVKERVVPPWWVKPLFIVMAGIILALVGAISYLKFLM